jgi:hypothetical protein
MVTSLGPTPPVLVVTVSTHNPPCEQRLAVAGVGTGQWMLALVWLVVLSPFPPLRHPPCPIPVVPRCHPHCPVSVIPHCHPPCPVPIVPHHHPPCPIPVIPCRHLPCPVRRLFLIVRVLVLVCVGSTPPCRSFSVVCCSSSLGVGAGI